MKCEGPMVRSTEKSCCFFWIFNHCFVRKPQATGTLHFYSGRWCEIQGQLWEGGRIGDPGLIEISATSTLCLPAFLSDTRNHDQRRLPYVTNLQVNLTGIKRQCPNFITDRFLLLSATSTTKVHHRIWIVMQLVKKRPLQTSGH